MKKLKTDIMGCSTQNCAKKMKEQNNHQDLICCYNSNLGSTLLRHEGCSEKRKSLIVPSAQKCHKKVLCSKVTGKQMDIHRQNITLFKHSSFVIGILLGLMCCGSLHAKGRTSTFHNF
jgi:hypothetical protein